MRMDSTEIRRARPEEEIEITREEETTEEVERQRYVRRLEFQTRERYGFLEDSDARSRMVRGILDRLYRHIDLPRGRERIIGGPDVNAFVIKDHADVYLHDGLLRQLAAWCEARGVTLTEDKIAMIAAHELSHISQHTEEISPENEREQTMFEIQKKRRNQEYDADRAGLLLMARAGFNPREGIAALEFLQSLGENFAVTSTHPRSSERLREIRMLVESPDTIIPGLDSAPYAIDPDAREKIAETELFYPGNRLYTEEGRSHLPEMLESANTIYDAFEIASVAYAHDRLESARKISNVEKVQQLQAKRIFVHNLNGAIDAIAKQIDFKVWIDDHHGEESFDKAYDMSEVSNRTRFVDENFDYGAGRETNADLRKELVARYEREVEDRIILLKRNLERTIDGLQEKLTPRAHEGYEDYDYEDDYYGYEGEDRQEDRRLKRRDKKGRKEGKRKGGGGGGSETERQALEMLKDIKLGLDHALGSVSASDLRILFENATYLVEDSGESWAEMRSMQNMVRRAGVARILDWCRRDGSVFFHDAMRSMSKEVERKSAGIIDTRTLVREPQFGDVSPENLLDPAGREVFMRRAREQFFIDHITDEMEKRRYVLDFVEYPEMITAKHGIYDSDSDVLQKWLRERLPVAPGKHAESVKQGLTQKIAGRYRHNEDLNVRFEKVIRLAEWVSENLFLDGSDARSGELQEIIDSLSREEILSIVKAFPAAAAETKASVSPLSAANTSYLHSETPHFGRLFVILESRIAAAALSRLRESEQEGEAAVFDAKDVLRNLAEKAAVSVPEAVAAYQGQVIEVLKRDPITDVEDLRDILKKFDAYQGDLKFLSAVVNDLVGKVPAVELMTLFPVKDPGYRISDKGTVEAMRFCRRIFLSEEWKGMSSEGKIKFLEAFFRTQFRNLNFMNERWNLTDANEEIEKDEDEFEDSWEESAGSEHGEYGLNEAELLPMRMMETYLNLQKLISPTNSAAKGFLELLRSNEDFIDWDMIARDRSGEWAQYVESLSDEDVVFILSEYKKHRQNMQDELGEDYANMRYHGEQRIMFLRKLYRRALMNFNSTHDRELEPGLEDRLRFFMNEPDIDKGDPKFKHEKRNQELVYLFDTKNKSLQENLRFVVDAVPEYFQSEIVRQCAEAYGLRAPHSWFDESVWPGGLISLLPKIPSQCYSRENILHRMRYGDIEEMAGKYKDHAPSIFSESAAVNSYQLRFELIDKQIRQGKVINNRLRSPVERVRDLRALIPETTDVLDIYLLTLEERVLLEMKAYFDGIAVTKNDGTSFSDEEAKMLIEMYREGLTFFHSTEHQTVWSRRIDWLHGEYFATGTESFADEFGRIMNDYPSASYARDEALLRFGDSDAVRTPEQAEMIQKQLFQAVRRTAGEREQSQQSRLDTLSDLVAYLSADERKDFMLWVMGVTAEPPLSAKAIGGSLGRSMRDVPKGLFEATEQERRELFYRLLLGNHGCLDPATPEEERTMQTFLRSSADHLFSGLEDEIGERGSDIVRKIWLTAIEKHQPFRRAIIITKTIEALKLTEKRDVGSLAKAVLESLGPVFIKAGQVLSEEETSPGEFLLPENMRLPLAELRENVSTFSRLAALQSLDASREFTPDSSESVVGVETLLAAASMKQSYRATLNDGTIVAEKILRPSITKHLDEDLRVLSEVVRAIEDDIEVPVRLTERVESWLRTESDFRQESENHRAIEAVLEGFQTARSDADRAKVPTIRTPKLLRHGDTFVREEFIEGRSLASMMEGDPASYREERRQIFDAMLYQIFHEGVFHADPHPGNIFITPENDVVFLDFGNVGRIEPEKQMALRMFFTGSFFKNRDMVLGGLREFVPDLTYEQANEIETTLSDASKTLPEILKQVSFSISSSEVHEGFGKLTKTLTTGSYLLRGISDMEVGALVMKHLG